MVLLRPQVVIAGTAGGMPSRPTLSMSGVQLVAQGGVIWAKKGAWLRNQPYTAVIPHNGQIQVRIHFGDLASAAKGRRGLDPETGLPQAAAEIAKRMPGYKAPNRLSRPYPSEIRRTFRVKSELESLAKQRGIARAS